jgi:hypothetical protein
MLQLTELTLSWHRKSYKVNKARKEHSELDRVQTWITSITSMRSAVGWKKGRSVAHRRTRVPSASSVAFTSAPVDTNAESHVSKGSISSDGLEEEDENCGYPSQDRDVLAKRPRAMAKVRGKTLIHYISILIVFPL